MAARTVDGPAENYLTLEQVAAHTGLSKAAIRKLMEEGKFPRPALPGKGQAGNQWTWRQVIYWNLHVEMRPYLRKSKPKPPDGAAGEKKKPKSDSA